MGSKIQNLMRKYSISALMGALEKQRAYSTAAGGYSGGGVSGIRDNDPRKRFSKSENKWERIGNNRYWLANDSLVRSGSSAADADRLARILAAQSALEAGWVDEAKGNNYAGYMSKGKRMSFDSPESFWDYHIENLDKKWPGWRNSDSIDSYLDTINNTSLGLNTKEKYDAYNKEHRDNPVYIYAPEWENTNYRDRMKNVYDKYISTYVPQKEFSFGGDMDNANYFDKAGRLRRRQRRATLLQEYPDESAQESLRVNLPYTDDSMQPEDVYFGGSLPEVTVSAELPEKFHGSQAAARRYAEAYKFGKDIIQKRDREFERYAPVVFGLPVAAGLGAAALAPMATMSAAEVGSALANGLSYLQPSKYIDWAVRGFSPVAQGMLGQSPWYGLATTLPGAAADLAMDSYFMAEGAKNAGKTGSTSGEIVNAANFLPAIGAVAAGARLAKNGINAYRAAKPAFEVDLADYGNLLPGFRAGDPVELQNVVGRYRADEVRRQIEETNQRIAAARGRVNSSLPEQALQAEATNLVEPPVQRPIRINPETRTGTVTPIGQVDLDAPGTIHAIRNYQNMSDEDLMISYNRARMDYTMSDAANEYAAEIRRRARAQLPAWATGDATGLSARELYELESSAMSYDIDNLIYRANTGLRSFDSERVPDVYDIRRNLRQELQRRYENYAPNGPTDDLYEAAGAMRYLSSSNLDYRTRMDRKNAIRSAIHGALEDAVRNQTDVPSEFSRDIQAYAEDMFDAGEIDRSNKYITEILNEYKDRVDRADLKSLMRQVSSESILNASDNSSDALRKLSNYFNGDRRAMLDAVNNFESMPEEVQKIILSSYGKPEYRPMTLSGLDQERNEIAVSRLAELLKQAGFSGDISVLANPGSDEYIAMAKSLHDMGIHDLPADIQHQSWFQVQNAGSDPSSKKQAMMDVGIQARMLQKALPRYAAMAEHNTSPDSYRVMLSRSLDNYGYEPGQYSVIPYTNADGTPDMYLGNSLQLNKIGWKNGNIASLMDVPGIEGLYSHDDLINLKSEIAALGTNAPGDIARFLSSNPDKLELANKILKSAYLSNMADVSGNNAVIKKILRKDPTLKLQFAETTIPESIDLNDPGGSIRSLMDIMETLEDSRAVYTPRMMRQKISTIKHKYGGLLNTSDTLLSDYALGGKINIKPENRGKAVFALNAGKRKHGDGGIIERMRSVYGDNIEAMHEAIRAARNK